MSVLELAYIALVILAAISIFVMPVHNKLLKYGTWAGIILLTLAHLFLEGYRVQMIPAYCLGVLTFLLIRKRANGRQIFSGKWPRFLYILILVLWIPTTILLPILFPVFHIPTPTGPYPTGRIEYQIETGQREQRITVWYPATVTEARKAAYLQTSDTIPEEIFHKVPPFLLSYLGKIKANAREEVPVAANKNGFPVIILSHAFPGANFMYTGLAEELASHGFIVAATGLRDQKQVIDSLYLLNKGPLIKDGIDLKNIGVIRHLNRETRPFPPDERIKADAFMNRSNPMDLSGNSNALLTLEVDGQIKFFASLAGATQMSLTDFYFYSPYFSIRDRVKPLDDQKTLSSVVVQFFKKTLYGDTQTIFDGKEIPFERLTISQRSSSEDDK